MLITKSGTNAVSVTMVYTEISKANTAMTHDAIAQICVACLKFFRKDLI